MILQRHIRSSLHYSYGQSENYFENMNSSLQTVILHTLFKKNCAVHD